jgi:hypothetical protein
MEKLRLLPWTRGLADDRGIETLEWIVVGALIVLIAIAVYPGQLQQQLTNAINTIGNTVNTVASS